MLATPTDSIVEKPRIFFQSLKLGYQECIHQGFQFLGRSGEIKPGDRIYIKPNLTFPTFRKGVMTNPEAIEALIVYLKNFTDRITVCESDSGGYNRFSMDEVFDRIGITGFQQRYGIKIANLSFVEARPIHFRYRIKSFSVPLPICLLDESDLFITMPVPKIHCNTVVSLGLKNQWGIIQEPALRLKLHPYFQEVIYRVNKAIPRMLVLLDGKYGLTRNGPMRGDDLQLDWFLMADNVFYADFAISRMMGFDYREIRYLKYIFSRERIPQPGGFVTNMDLPMVSRVFYLRREWTDYPGLFTFNSRSLAYIGYESCFARPLHWLLYKWRERFY